MAVILWLGAGNLPFLMDVQGAPGRSTPVQHVVLISIDGLRPDAIEIANAENLKALIRRGVWCPKAETIRPSLTLPSHTSMLTGLDIKHHGVQWNEGRGGHVQHPTVLLWAKEAGWSTAMFIGKDKLEYLATPGKVDLVAGAVPGKSGWAMSEELAAAFETQWPKKKYAVTFVHLPDPDMAGHGTGWMSPAYLEAVRTSDRAVGRIIRTVDKAGVMDQTIFIVTSDHGGKDTNHAEPIPENYTIPWICAGPGVKPGTVIDRIVMTYDSSPTILRLLGMTVPDGLDGKPVEEVLPATNIKKGQP